MKNILSVFDDGGKSFDRYTIVLKEKEHGKWVCLGLSINTTSPNGFSQFSNCEVGPHLGKKIKWNALPAHVKKHAEERLTPFFVSAAPFFTHKFSE